MSRLINSSDRRHDQWESSWQSWTHIEREYRIYRAKNSRDLYATMLVGISVWQAGLVAYIWRYGIHQVSTPLLLDSVLNWAVILILWSMTWAHQDFIEWAERRLEN